MVSTRNIHFARCLSPFVLEGGSRRDVLRTSAAPPSQICLALIANFKCHRGGDTAEGITNTAVPLSSAAVSQIKAAIFMGDPRFVAGLSYEVGTCKAGGVSNLFHDLYLRFTDFLP